jgi:hypothetical protein
VGRASQATDVAPSPSDGNGARRPPKQEHRSGPRHQPTHCQEPSRQDHEANRIQLFVRACAVGADCGGRRVGGRAFRRGIGPSRRRLTVYCDLSARRGFVGHFCSIDQIHDIHAFRERRLSYLWRRCEPSDVTGRSASPYAASQQQNTFPAPGASGTATRMEIHQALSAKTTCRICRCPRVGRRLGQPNSAMAGGSNEN